MATKLAAVGPVILDCFYTGSSARRDKPGPALAFTSHETPKVHDPFAYGLCFEGFDPFTQITLRMPGTMRPHAVWRRSPVSVRSPRR